MDEHFTVEQTDALSLDGLPAAGNIQEFLGTEGEMERAARVISLEQALNIAVNHSRLYQNQKEQLFLAALGLTLARHQFAPIFSAGVAGSYNVTTVPVEDTIPDPSDPTGQRLLSVVSYEMTDKYNACTYVPSLC